MTRRAALFLRKRSAIFAEYDTERTMRFRGSDQGISMQQELEARLKFWPAIGLLVGPFLMGVSAHSWTSCFFTSIEGGFQEGASILPGDQPQ